MSQLAGLPLPLRIAIRDKFDPATTSVQKALANLNSTVGYDFSITISWVDIHRDLASKFPDIQTLVPCIADALTVYIDRIIALLDDEKFQEAFLEKFEAPFHRYILVQIGEQTDKDTSEIDRNGKLALTLPTAGADWFRRNSSRIGIDLESVFLKTGKSVAASSAPTTSGKTGTSEWVDVDTSLSQKISVLSLPSLDSLGKPETLSKTLLPYYIIVEGSGHRLHIEGSHQPTIDLVHSYLHKNTRKNMNLTTQAPYLNVQLKQSNWGSQIYEIDIRLEDERNANWAAKGGVTFILAFLTSACGYELEKIKPGWYFLSRKTAFE